MFVIKKMRLNRFQPRPIVSNRELFLAKGECPGTIDSKESAECFNEPSLQGASKTQILGLAQKIGQKAYEFSKNPDSTKPLVESVKPL